MRGDAIVLQKGIQDKMCITTFEQTTQKNIKATDRFSSKGNKSSSEKAGCRLYQQALESEKRKNAMRSKALAVEAKTKDLVFATSKKKQRRGRSRNKGFVRLCEIYESGKEKIIADRERYKKKKEDEIKYCKTKKLPIIRSRKINERRSRSKLREERNIRLREIYELGKRKIILDRERYENQRKLQGDDTKSNLLVSSKKVFGNERQNYFSHELEKEGPAHKTYQRKWKNEKENS